MVELGLVEEGEVVRLDEKKKHTFLHISIRWKNIIETKVYS